MQNEPNEIDFEKEKESLLSIGDSADFLGVSVDTLRRWEKREKIIAYRSPGGHRYFKKSDLENLFGTKYERIDEDEDEDVDKDTVKKDKKEPVETEQIKEPTDTTTTTAQNVNTQKDDEGSVQEREAREVKIPDLTPITTSTTQTPSDTASSGLRPETAESNLTNKQHAKISEILSYETQEEEKEKDEKSKFNWNIVIIIFLVLFFALDVYLLFTLLGNSQMVSPIP